MDVLTQAHPIATAPTIWFEVEDLLRHFDGAGHPTGIPRVCLEIVKAAQAHYAARVRFCRLSRLSCRFEPVSFADLIVLCSVSAYGRLPSVGQHRGINFREIRRGLRYLWRVASATLKDSMRYFDRRRAKEELFSRGDILVEMGTGWTNSRYGASIAAIKAQRGLRYITLIHDIIALTHPQYYYDRSNEKFRRWLENVFDNADLIFTSSVYCSNRLIEFGDREGLRVPPIKTIPFGSAFTLAHSSAVSDAMDWPGQFVLMVSTVEIRKNHLLMLHVWRRLIQSHGADSVPTLIFVGQIGWRVENLIAELKATRFLNGKIVMARDLSDFALDDAYGRALFTVFPSFCEGWGMPVSESLSHGTFCICSNAASLPEVGGDFVDYFDPTDENQAFAAVERAIFDPEYLAGRKADLRTRYPPKSWDACVHRMIDWLSLLAGPSAPDSRSS
jgi:glycosyltransferase involved in cell wall biosynthesis